jgi:ribosomal subunit interface protein
VEIALCGRNVEVPEHFREHTAEKLIRLERYDHKIVRMDVELSHEPNPRRAKTCQQVEITGRGKGPVVRAEGCAADFYSALDQALARLEGRLRRAHDRRCVSHGRRVPMSVARAMSAVDAAAEPASGAATGLLERELDEPVTGPDLNGASLDVPGARVPADEDHLPGQVVRRKEHYAVPMTVDDALSQMELVGHDFFLFSDAETGRPSVVYRRHGYDYGVIALV